MGLFVCKPRPKQRDNELELEKFNEVTLFSVAKRWDFSFVSQIPDSEIINMEYLMANTLPEISSLFIYMKDCVVLYMYLMISNVHNVVKSSFKIAEIQIDFESKCPSLSP